MTEETHGVLFTDGESRIFFHPPQPYPDGHGFHHQVDLVGGPFCGAINASSYEGLESLSAFHKELIGLYENLKGEARLPNSYNNIKVSLVGDGMGHARVQVVAFAGNFMDTRLSFGFQIDQTGLPAIISAVERLFLKPERLES